ncbi:sigma-70 family RNA polymerase sigma factor [Streptomyces sp. col6]|nr:sigma-70 family RNA polymerase sigma factor [Streptomyces sp. col6]
MSTAGGGTEPAGSSGHQVPSQTGPGHQADQDDAGGTVLPGPWPPAPVEDGGAPGASGSPGAGPAEAIPSVPMQRAGRGSGSVDGAAAGPSDAQLIQRMREGDDLAYDELFRRHSQAVRRYARTCCRDAHTADDLTAEVFARTLQAVRGGKGPEEAVRAYLMTAVRHVAAAWTKTAKREHLVDDFAAFAAQAARSSEMSDADTLDLGADVLAMHEAEQTMAMRAFRSLPERWQAVLWHTTVEEESPSDIAPLFGLTANATSVLASRAREGLKQAYLQAHVSQALTAGGDCARYADRLGAYARGGLRMRAERGLRGHLDECAKCRVAAGELAQVNAGIPALLPVAVIGWFAAGYALKAAGIVAGGAAGAAGAGAAAAATGGGSSAGSAGGAAASEGLGAPAKAGIAAAVAVAAAAGLVWALVGDDSPRPEAKPAAKPPAVAPAVPSPTPPKPTPPKPEPTPPAPEVYQVSEMDYTLFGDHTSPEVVLGESGWVWQRSGMSIGGSRYVHGVTVNSRSSVVIQLNRQCTRYEAMVGVDDLTMGLGAVRFSVYGGDGTRLWQSPVVRGDDPAVPVGVNVAGQKRIRLVVEPEQPFGGIALADWADSRISCR